MRCSAILLTIAVFFGPALFASANEPITRLPVRPKSISDCAKNIKKPIIQLPMDARRIWIQYLIELKKYNLTVLPDQLQRRGPYTVANFGTSDYAYFQVKECCGHAAASFFTALENTPQHTLLKVHKTEKPDELIFEFISENSTVRFRTRLSPKRFWQKLTE